MPPILLKSIKLPVPKQKRENNIENGNDAEVYAASLIIKAIGAEVSWSSRNEDGRKIDLYARMTILGLIRKEYFFYSG